MNIRLEDLIKINPDDLTVRSRESVHTEFKSTYEHESLSKYAKTIAAMANTDGGNIYFGIEDRPNRIIGIDFSIIPDSAILANSLDKWFEPSIKFDIFELDYSGRSVFLLKVYESSIKPIICKKNMTVAVEGKADKLVLSEGAIYRRYYGKTDKIRFSELHEIFLERDKIIYSALMENMRHIQRIGVDRVGIADVSSLGSGDEPTRIYLSKETMTNLNFIEKGNFVETEAEGDASYFVVGTVRLHETTEVPIDDGDRRKPGQVAKVLSEKARKHLFPTFNLTSTHLAKYARLCGFRNSCDDFNNRYCKWDEQAGLWFYREQFSRHVRKNLIENPRDTLAKLSSSINLSKYDLYHK